MPRCEQRGGDALLLVADETVRDNLLLGKPGPEEFLYCLLGVRWTATTVARAQSSAVLPNSAVVTAVSCPPAGILETRIIWNRYVALLPNEKGI